MVGSLYNFENSRRCSCTRAIGEGNPRACNLLAATTLPANCVDHHFFAAASSPQKHPSAVFLASQGLSCCIVSPPATAGRSNSEKLLSFSLVLSFLNVWQRRVLLRQPAHRCKLLVDAPPNIASMLSRGSLSLFALSFSVMFYL
ncbi:hypothetical protein HPP92_021608 [Vanilla planifolia]|uniref:Uncharacterized protein n=1 Tax=Vanilla planifolia TaxID=51239 RepID=A0A835PZF8_VANPL|nr:hypothetical protein HPP92_021608 [Vanilla planifolia]